MPSGDATTDLAVEATIGRIGAYFAERGVLGFVWLDEHLLVTARHGALVDLFVVGSPASDCFPALFGLESTLAEQRSAPHEYLELPDVTIATGRAGAPSLSVVAFWDNDIARHTLLVSSRASRADLEVELSRQMRARLMAEEELAAQARELARLNAELERANRDLEDYASIISHDLASPLRGLRHMADDIATSLGAEATAGISGKLADLKRQSSRMSGMLTSLLDYSSAGRKEDVAVRIDTAALVAEIVASIPRPDRLAVRVDGDWPMLITPAAALDLVLRNLIDNAVKHHDRAEGRIDVSAAVEPGWLLISVADDGPGIPAAGSHAVFLPFRTLAPSSASASRGMGLAIVARTLEAAGGSVTVHERDDGGRGTIFRVRWPAGA